jgi:hypothetical protein
MHHLIKSVIKQKTKKTRNGVNTLILAYTVCNEIALIYNDDIHEIYKNTPVNLENAKNDFNYEIQFM